MLFDSIITNIQHREVPFLFENIQSLPPKRWRAGPPILSEANPAQKIAGRRRPALGEESNWSVISQLIQNVELYRKLKLHLSPQRLPAEVGYSTFQ